MAGGLQQRTLAGIAAAQFVSDLGLELDPRGNILGVLDVSGDHRSYHQHTMALVKMSARMIENHWLSDDHRNAMRLHFHQRPEFIDTLMEGILAVAPDGRVWVTNKGAATISVLSPSTLTS